MVSYSLHNSNGLPQRQQTVFLKGNTLVQPAFSGGLSTPKLGMPELSSVRDSVTFSGQGISELPWEDPFVDAYTGQFSAFFKLLQAKTNNAELQWTDDHHTEMVDIDTKKETPFQGELQVSQYLSLPSNALASVKHKPVLVIQNKIKGTALAWINIVHFDDPSKARFLTSTELNEGIAFEETSIRSLGLNSNTSNLNEQALLNDLETTLIPTVQSTLLLTRPYREALKAVKTFSRQTQLSQMQWLDHMHYVYKERTSPVTKEVESQQWAIEQYVSRTSGDSQEKGAVLVKMYPTQNPDPENCYYGFIPISLEQEEALNQEGTSADVLKLIESSSDKLLIRASQSKPHQQQVADAIKKLLNTIDQHETKKPSAALGIPWRISATNDDVDGVQLRYGHPLVESGVYYEDADGADVKQVLITLKEATEKLNLPWQCKQFPTIHYSDNHNKGDTEEVSQVRLQLNGNSVFIVHREYRDAGKHTGEHDYALMVPQYPYRNFLPLSLIIQKLDNNEHQFNPNQDGFNPERYSEPGGLKMTRKTVVSNYYEGSGFTYLPDFNEDQDTLSMLNLDQNADLRPLFEWFLDRGFTNSSVTQP